MGEQHWMHLRDESATELINQKFNVPVLKPHPDAPNQPEYFRAIDSAKAVICTGPAGTGKTYVACAKAIEALRRRKVERIVLTRPLKECGQEMGFLPGDLYEKVVDMMMPLIEALEEFTSPVEVERMRANGTLQIVPMEKMRGRTLKNAFVILDEAQNATFSQLRMFVTRFGSKAKMVVCGDYTQSDLPYAGMNSLYELVERFRRMPEQHPAVRHVILTEDDIVRDELVRWFVQATSGPFNQDKQESVDRGQCPKCSAPFVAGPDVRANNYLVECKACGTEIDCYDENGRFDPVEAD